MCRTPTTHESGWIRFQKYAFLVREIITVPFYRSWDVDAGLLEDTFWCQLFFAFGDALVLLRVEGATVRSTPSRRSINAGVLWLVKPSIRKPNVAFPLSSETELKQLGKSLVCCFSSIQNLKVLSMEVPNLAPFMDVEAFPWLRPHLRYRLKLDRGAPIKFSCLRPLAILPSREYLNINPLP